MNPTALVRDFTCPVCGAPRTLAVHAIVVLCIHCGAVLALSGEGNALAGQHATGIRRIVNPTLAEARLGAVGLEMLAVNDRARWRLLCEEQVLLMAIVHPDHVAPLPAEPGRRATHLQQAVALSEIATFDPEVRQRLAAYGVAASRLARGEAVAAAREMLVAARTYFAALAAHADTPPGALREGPEHLAREMVRAAIGGYASLLGVGDIERIRRDVLGDTDRSMCARCGAPLDARTAGLAACRHCGAVVGLSLDDAWLSAQLEVWKIAQRELVRRGDLDGPGPVVAALGCFFWTCTVPPENARAFLRRAIPWVPRSELLGGLDLVALAANEEQRATLEQLRVVLGDWTGDPTARPAPHVAVVDFPPPSPEDEAAWIDTALALHRHRGGALVDLLGQCLATIQIAAVHEAPSGVSAPAAMTFFERAKPGYDRRKMLEVLEPLRAGYDHPRVRSFTSALVELLRSRTPG